MEGTYGFGHWILKPYYKVQNGRLESRGGAFCHALLSLKVFSYTTLLFSPQSSFGICVVLAIFFMLLHKTKSNNWQALMLVPPELEIFIAIMIVISEQPIIDTESVRMLVLWQPFLL